MKKQMVMTTKTSPPATYEQGGNLTNLPMELVEILYEDFRKRHGPILGGGDLAKAMGYRSLAAFRQARRRGQVEVELFSLPNRRGVFALGFDVAKWLAQASQANKTVPTQGDSST